MAFVKAILYKSKKLKDSTSPIAIKASKDKKVKYYFLNKTIDPFHWVYELFEEIKNS